MTLFHADGDSTSETLPEIEARLRTARGVEEGDAGVVRAARAARPPTSAPLVD